MDELQLEQMKVEWQKLSAPDLVVEINRLCVLFAQEGKRLRDAVPNKAVFNSGISYYKPLNALFDELNTRLLNGEEITLHYNIYIEPEGLDVSAKDVKLIPQTMRFTSDKDGNYYFDGNKIIVKHDYKWAYKLLKKKITTWCSRPVDFYLSFLDTKSKYTPERNVFVSAGEMICEKYKGE